MVAIVRGLYLNRILLVFFCKSFFLGTFRVLCISLRTDNLLFFVLNVMILDAMLSSNVNICTSLFVTENFTSQILL